METHYGTIQALMCLQYPDGGIGYLNDLIWKGLKGDMKIFKEKTVEHVVIMGHGTFSSLGFKPLPNRQNIVITREPNELKEYEHIHIATNPIEALHLARKQWPKKDICIIGGAQICRELLPYCQKLFITEVHGNKTADTLMHLPEGLIEISREKGPDETYEYFFVEYKNPNALEIPEDK